MPRRTPAPPSRSNAVTGLSGAARGAGSPPAPPALRTSSCSACRNTNCSRSRRRRRRRAVGPCSSGRPARRACGRRGATLWAGRARARARSAGRPALPRALLAAPAGDEARAARRRRSGASGDPSRRRTRADARFVRFQRLSADEEPALGFVDAGELRVLFDDLRHRRPRLDLHEPHLRARATVFFRNLFATTRRLRGRGGAGPHLARLLVRRADRVGRHRSAAGMGPPLQTPKARVGDNDNSGGGCPRGARVIWGTFGGFGYFLSFPFLRKKPLGEIVGFAAARSRSRGPAGSPAPQRLWPQSKSGGSGGAGAGGSGGGGRGARGVGDGPPKERR